MQRAEEAGGLVALLAMVPLTLLCLLLQGGGGLGALRGKRGCHMEVTSVSPSSCSSDQLWAAAKPVQHQSCEEMLVFPSSEGRPSLGSAQSLSNPLLEANCSSVSHLCNFSAWGGSRVGAEQSIASAGPQGRWSLAWVLGSPSADACCHPVASAGKFRGAMPSCLAPSHPYPPGQLQVGPGSIMTPSLGCRGLGCAGFVFAGAGSP